MSSNPLKLKRLACASLIAIASGLGAAGCTDDPAPTQPSTTGAVAIESFVGTLPKGGSAFYSFTVPRQGSVSLTLLSLTIGGAPADGTITMGLGVPRGTGCTTTTQVGVTPGINPQSTNPVSTPSIYCVNLNDPGNLSADASFAVNIARPR